MWKVKVGTYSAAYMSQHSWQHCFTISTEPDWNELMIMQWGALCRYADIHFPYYYTTAPAVQPANIQPPHQSLTCCMLRPTQPPTVSGIWNKQYLTPQWQERRSLAGLAGELSITCSTGSWRVTTYVGELSAGGQPTRSTQPFILSGSINE